MAVAISDKVVTIAQSDNPKLALIKAVGDLTKEEVCWDLVLVATYFRPEKTKGGIIRPKENIQEDAFQGKVGMVLKTGPECGNQPLLAMGDWVVYSVNDGWSITINETPCRIVPYDRIRMKISDPAKVF